MIGIKKPTKASRPNLIRKREIKRKDKELSVKTRTERCEKCGRIGMTDPHHKIRRRFMATRFDPSNIIRLCRICHSLTHSSPNQ